MAQMDPAKTKNSLEASEYLTSAVAPAVAHREGPVNADSNDSYRAGIPFSSTGKKLLAALHSCADETAASIAESGKQARADVRERLNEVVEWISANLRSSPNRSPDAPPVIAREYVASLRVHFLSHIRTIPDLNAQEVILALLKFDEAEDAWRRTDRGKFISRLTGTDCADAVVAIAHDIRSPLGSILLLVESLRRSERDSPNRFRERQLGLIYGAAFGLSTTVSNLIAAARGDGLVQGTPAPFSVSEMMHSVNDIVQPMCEEKGIPLRMEFPVHDARIGFASAIQQALLNLVSNGLRYTDTGSVEMGGCELAGDCVEFWVADTGPGIPDDVLERLCYGFPPEGFKLRFSSAGLGLAIVRTLVEAMGSSLQVDSGQDGSRFSFVVALPILQ